MSANAKTIERTSDMWASIVATVGEQTGRST